MVNASKIRDTPHRVTDPGASPRQLRPVLWWASFGGLWLTFMAAVLISWVSGPYFEPVPVGPTDPPVYMKVFLMALQVTMIPVMGALLWWFVVRPCRRERKVTVDGALTLAFCTLFFQDPLSNYFGPWITYNAWSWNRGSWVTSVPGWMSFAAPGAMVLEPPLTIIGLYVLIMTIAVRIGVATLKRASARWPRMGKVGLFLICWAVMFVFDVIFEGVAFMPMGSWEYPGGHVKIFADTFHAYPLNEAVTTGAIFTMFACIKYFTNDRGQSLAERGAERLGGGPARVTAIRALAVIGLVTLAMTVGYTIPNTWFGAHSTAWNRDIQTRSYLTYTCGEGPGIACPAPDIPVLRNDNRDQGANGRDFGRNYPPQFRYNRG